jgi:hypothetical protein
VIDTVDIERGFLAAIALNGSLMEQVSTITADCFTTELHRLMWRGCESLKANGAPIDEETLTEWLRANKFLEKVGGAAVVRELIDFGMRRSAVDWHVRQLRNAYAKRFAAHTCEALGQQALNGVDHEELAAKFADAAKTILEYGSNGASGLDLAQLPDPLELSEQSEAWQVPGIILKGGVTILSGAPGDGKTWQALAIARAVGFGGEYLCRQCEQAEVIILDRENPLSVMQSRWRTIFGGPAPGHVKTWARYSGLGEVPMLGDSRLLEIAKPGRLLVFDALIDFHTADENSSTEMQPVLDEVRKLADAGASVLVLHHRGKSDTSRSRGSSAIEAGADVACSLIKDSEGFLTLDVWKTRGTPEFKLRIKPDYESGRFELVDSPALVERRDDVQAIAEAIAADPGCSQIKVLKTAGIRRQRAIDLLRENPERLWRVEHGERGAFRYYPTCSGSGNRSEHPEHVPVPVPTINSGEQGTGRGLTGGLQ